MVRLLTRSATAPANRVRKIWGGNLKSRPLPGMPNASADRQASSGQSPESMCRPEDTSIPSQYDAKIPDLKEKKTSTIMTSAPHPVGNAGKVFACGHRAGVRASLPRRCSLVAPAPSAAGKNKSGRHWRNTKARSSAQATHTGHTAPRTRRSSRKAPSLYLCSAAAPGAFR